MTETTATTATRLPQQAIELMKAPNFGHLATIMPDGSPQVTPVWVDTDGTFVLINTARGRQKTRNLEKNSRVAIDVLNQGNPYQYVQVRGHVADITRDGAEAMIHQLSDKYTGNPRYPLQPGEQRVIIKIAPEHIHMNG